jgi:hypothetical protein
MFVNTIKRFLVSEDGPTAVEYAVYARPDHRSLSHCHSGGRHQRERQVQYRQERSHMTAP